MHWWVAIRLFYVWYSLVHRKSDCCSMSTDSELWKHLPATHATPISVWKLIVAITTAEQIGLFSLSPLDCLQPLNHTVSSLLPVEQRDESRNFHGYLTMLRASIKKGSTQIHGLPQFLQQLLMLQASTEEAVWPYFGLSASPLFRHCFFVIASYGEVSTIRKLLS